MPSNGRQHKPEICRVCELPSVVIEDLDVRFAAGQRNTDITRYMRSSNIGPIPSATMLNRHRNKRHYMGDRTVRESSDNPLAADHRDGISLVQRVQLNIAHVLLPRLALAPKSINVAEEKNELYAFTKNQLAIEFEVNQNTPQVYEHPVTGETQLITPTSPAMLKIIRELRNQLESIEETTKTLLQTDDITAEIKLALMEDIRGDDNILEKIEDHMYQISDLADDEVDELDQGVSGK